MRPVLLVLRALGLGDLLTGVPALRALRRAYPEHEIVLAAPAVLWPLVATTGAVDRLWPTPAYVRGPMESLEFGGTRPSIAVNLHGRGPQSHRALAALHPDRLLAFGCRSAGFAFGPKWTEKDHEVARWCRMLSWYGMAADPEDLLLPVPAERPRWTDVTVVHPGASTADRHWPVERFTELAGRLAADGHRVVLTGTREERGRAEAVAARVPGANVLAGRTTLAALAALVARARLVVCGDTGIAHLATAYRTPSVVLFSAMSPAQWGPPDRPEHVALWHGTDGLASIGVDEVLGATRVVTPERGRATPAR